MPAITEDNPLALEKPSGLEGHVFPAPSHDDAIVNEKDDAAAVKEGVLAPKVTDATSSSRSDPGDRDRDRDSDSDGAIIITGADAAAHLLPLRDDGDPVITFRSILLASGLACFQAVMTQIYTVATASQA